MRVASRINWSSAAELAAHAWEHFATMPCAAGFGATLHQLGRPKTLNLSSACSLQSDDRYDRYPVNASEHEDFLE